MTKVLISGSDSVLTEEILKPMIDRQYEIVHLIGRAPSDEQIISVIGDANAYLCGGFEYLSSDVLKVARELRCVSLLGEDHHGFLGVEFATSKGIKITNTPGATTEAVAQFAVAQAFVLTRALTSLYEQGRLSLNGQEPDVPEVAELASQHVGILGMGRIGKRVAEVCHTAFGCRISYFSRSKSEFAEDDLKASRLSLANVFLTCDIVIECLPATTETDGLIGSSVLANTRLNAFVSISKSTTKDVPALIEAFQDGHIRSVALDWIDKNDIAYLSTKADLDPLRFLVTPHTANNTIDAWNRMAESAVGSLVNILETGKDVLVCNNG